MSGLSGVNETSKRVNETRVSKRGYARGARETREAKKCKMCVNLCDCNEHGTRAEAEGAQGTPWRDIKEA
jgi:hypothetical protein